MVNSVVEFVDIKGCGCKVIVKNCKSGKEEVIDCDFVFFVVGVSLNMENIGLEELGIIVDCGLIKVDVYYQINVFGIYVIGDVVVGFVLVYVVSVEGIICVEKIVGYYLELIDYNNILGCIYCVLEVVFVGYIEVVVKEAGYDIKVGKFLFIVLGKVKVVGVSEGFVKVIFDVKYGEWLGVYFIGVNVIEMIVEVVVVCKLEIIGYEIIKVVYFYLIMSEVVMEVVVVVYDEVIYL